MPEPKGTQPVDNGSADGADFLDMFNWATDPSVNAQPTTEPEKPVQPETDTNPDPIQNADTITLTKDQYDRSVMMQKDYTQKTQALAEERRKLAAEKEALTKQKATSASEAERNKIDSLQKNVEQLLKENRVAKMAQEENGFRTKFPNSFTCDYDLVQEKARKGEYKTPTGEFNQDAYLKDILNTPYGKAVIFAARDKDAKDLLGIEPMTLEQAFFAANGEQFFAEYAKMQQAEQERRSKWSTTPSTVSGSKPMEKTAGDSRTAYELGRESLKTFVEGM
jgi:hypothetical protein